MITPGKATGKVTRRKIVQGFAPSVIAASSSERSISRRTGITLRTTNGYVTNKSASTIPGAW